MSVRLNMYGFSLSQMRKLFRSRDKDAVLRIRDGLERERPHDRPDETQRIGEIVERAIMGGVPFPDLPKETYLHSRAAGALAGDRQEWLVTSASTYHASALAELLRRFGKHARPEIKAFLRDLVNGVPLFGREAPSEDSAYAAVSLEKPRFFQDGLADLRHQVTYRVGRNPSASDEDEGAVGFVSDFGGWVDEIIAEWRDLWSVLG